MGRLIELINKKYSTELTGSGFMMYEFKQILKLKLNGLSSDGIKEKVFEENIFQYKKKTSIKRAFPYLLKRVEVLDDELIRMAIDGDIRVAKTINLYSIMKTNQLFYEFMDEVVKELIKQPESVLEKRVVNVFFSNKAEQSEFIRNLAESTTKRLQSAFVNVLLEVGILTDLKSREIRRLIIDEQLKNHLIQIGDIKYLEAMGEYER